MKKYYIDRRVLVNGKTSNINNDNKVNLNSIIEQVVQESGGATTFTDTDGYNYLNVFGNTDQFTSIPVTTLEGYISEMKNGVDFGFDLFINTDSTLLGGTGTFQPYKFTRISTGDFESTFQQTRSYMEMEVDNADFQYLSACKVYIGAFEMVVEDQNNGTNYRVDSDASTGQLRIKTENPNLNSDSSIILYDNGNILIGNVDTVTGDSMSYGLINTGAIKTLSFGVQDGVTTNTITVNLEVNPTHPNKVYMSMTGLPIYADNAAALLAGESVDNIYKTPSGDIKIVV